MNRYSTLLLTGILAGSIGACSDDTPTPTNDSGVAGDAGACTTPGTIADPEPSTTGCAAPMVDGGAVPYYQCTSETICPRGRFANPDDGHAMTPFGGEIHPETPLLGMASC